MIEHHLAARAPSTTVRSLRELQWSPLHVGNAESAQAERCVGASGHQPRRGWPGPPFPLGVGHRGGAWSVRPSALVLNR